MSELKVNKVSPQSGTDFTLGDSGDTFTVPSGATLTVAGTFTQTGAQTFDGGVDIDNFNINGTTITLSSGDMTIDAQGNDTDIIFKGTDGSADTTFLTIDGSAAGAATFNNNVTVGDNLNMTTDSSVIAFGADSEITLTHSADVGLILKHTATADDKPINLILQTGETDMAANDVIGKISWQAPDEGTGTDAILVSAAIQAIAEGDHSSSSNATSLVFMTGASEAAAAKVKITSAGHLMPTADDSYDLGSASLQWRNVYTGDLHLSNMTKDVGNSVDGTKGDWTIQEGAEDLFLLNNNSGKKYKFNLTEVE